MASPALAIGVADALKRLNHESDQTLQLPEALDAAAKRFEELNKDNDLTLDKAETDGLVTDTEWKAHNRDQAPDQNPGRAAVGRDRSDVVLGTARLLSDHHAQSRRVTDPHRETP